MEEKKVRKAVRCFLIRENKVVVTKYKAGNLKAGYYEIPGGKIEEGETPEQAVMREFKEETGMQVSDLKRKGSMIVEYPNRIFNFETYVAQEYQGEPQEFEENTSEWITINELLKKEKILSNIIILNPFCIRSLLEEGKMFEMRIKVNEAEDIVSLKYDSQKGEE